ncbi:hypothetical protein BGZ60DRAFT_524566 [Tricladium varicosporioides]|nr:hypothetical protein BGZ60DRAFT_524566 [Hymenoscyphus varicosporioides]
MDPISIATSATAILGTCWETVRLIQKTIETVKNAKNLLVKLLSQTERFRLILEQLRGLSSQLGTKSGLLLSYNDSAPKATMKELNSLVKSMAEKPNFIGLQMLFKQSKVDDLVARLKLHEDEVVTVLLFMATTTALRSEDEIKMMHKDVKAQSEVLNLFEDYFTHDKKPKEAKDSAPAPAQKLQIWFGDNYREGFESEYLALRDELSDASFSGNFEKMFSTLELAEKKYGESWVNAPRLKKNPAGSSGWNPLHQTVFKGGSKAIVQRILNMGASRTLRTTSTDENEFAYKDMSALEIAHKLGYSHLNSLLAPVIHHGVPPITLDRLQRSFHDLIRADFTLPQSQYLRLPELAPLTELVVPEMWFPLKTLSAKKAPRGYMYRLDGRELVVKIFGIRSPDDERFYRISVAGRRAIAEGVAFNRKK